MSEKTPVYTRAAIKSTALGLLLMSFFTMLWAAIAFNGLKGRDYWITTAVFTALSAWFVSATFHLFGVVKQLPKVASAEDISRRRKQKWLWIIFAAESIGILLAINIAVNDNNPDLIIPAIALVIGLHFYPLGWVFNRTIDFYLATWSTMIAVLAIVFTVNKTLSQNDVSAFTGTGLAIAASCYGIFMATEGKRLEKTL